MAARDPYLQFPISLLQNMPAEPTKDERWNWLERVTDWTAYHLANSLRDKLEDVPTDRLHELVELTDVEPGDPNFWTHAAQIKLRRFALLDFEDIENGYFECQHRTTNYDAGRKQARIRMDLVPSIGAGHIPWPEFTVFAAVAACCNTKAAAVRVHREQLAAMAAGYGSAKAVPDDVVTLPVHRITYRLNKLERRGLLVAQCVSRRQLYVSLNMDHAELIQWLAVKCADKQKRIAAIPTKAERSASLQQAVADRVGPFAAERLGLNNTLTEQHKRDLRKLQELRRRDLGNQIDAENRRRYGHFDV